MDSPDEPTALRSSPTPPAPRRNDARFTPGSLLAERFRIIALLGKGGMGEVYRADDMKLGQQVALKFLPAALAQDSQKLERLYGEVRLGRQVSHPNVCRLYDVVEWEGNHFISMEYIDGEDLASLLRRIGKLPPDKALDIARDLAAGIAAAHAIGIVHRDLKPANVMIDGRGVARITDFGLAALSADLATTREISGTPSYMAPEQLTGGEATQRTDVYAFGLILYEVFTGKRLFEAESVGEIVSQHRSSHAHSISQQTREIDPAVQRVILRCLEEKPENRPSSITAVAHALPGGDPLQAAIDAGETPSPEMIAAAGEVGELQPGRAWGALALAIVAILLGAAISSRTKLYNRVALPNEPEVLVHRSKELLQRFGYGEAADASYFLNWDEEHFRRKNRGNPNEVHPSPVVFRYRTSPNELVPITSEERVDHEDPPFDFPGMTRVGIDPAGRLLYFGVVPLQLADGPDTPQQPVDWMKFIGETGVELASLRPIESKWAAPFDTDEKLAWEARFAGSGETVRIEAASFRGRPVWLELIPSWRRAVQPEVATLTPLEKLGRSFGQIIEIIVLITGGLLARRNWRRGRGDRKGAFRLGIFTFVVLFVGRWFRVDHSASLWNEWPLTLRLVSEALYEGAVIWVLYLALEPYVRRRWPRTLIAWTRLLSGRLRDPLVGRDVLFGVVAGAFFMVIQHTMLVFPGWIGQSELSPTRTFLTALSDVQQLFYIVSRALSFSTWGALFIGIVAIILQTLLRKRLAMMIALVAAFGILLPSGGENPPVEIAFKLVAGALVAFIFFRFGILATAAMLLVGSVLSDAPTTLDPSSWYFGRSLAILIALGALAAWSFRLAVADQPMFGKLLLEDDA